MKHSQPEIYETTLVDINTGLKETALTVIVNASGPGRLLGIYCIDPDNLAQNERLQIVIDGVLVFNDIAYDIPNTDEWLSLVASLAKGVAVAGTRVNTDIGQAGQQMSLPFARTMNISYLRAAAGTTGLTINAVFTRRSPLSVLY